mmetsp:Transcript_47670/g.132665  ORF Transcript_47670/g.132665 Transcript_47670/m.132665 type:complete len:216 (+) Transcript_47670:1244-1891(+)
MQEPPRCALQHQRPQYRAEGSHPDSAAGEAAALRRGRLRPEGPPVEGPHGQAWPSGLALPRAQPCQPGSPGCVRRGEPVLKQHRPGEAVCGLQCPRVLPAGGRKAHEGRLPRCTGSSMLAAWWLSRVQRSGLHFGQSRLCAGARPVRAPRSALRQARRAAVQRGRLPGSGVRGEGHSGPPRTSRPALPQAQPVSQQRLHNCGLQQAAVLQGGRGR